MNNIYDQLVQGIDEYNGSHLSIEQYLHSIQAKVCALRAAYRSYPVKNANYADKDVQSAYLLAYLPHHYQLIYKILQENNDWFFLNDDGGFTATFIGGGPGSEAIGLIAYMLNHQSDIRQININILDLNASTWYYSHQIVKSHLIDNNLVSWNASTFDLTDAQDVINHAGIFQQTNLLVFQNCINEIGKSQYAQLSQNVEAMYSYLPIAANLLMIDLTSGVRSELKKLQKQLVDVGNVAHVKSTLSNHSPSPLCSWNAKPSVFVKQHLLTGASGLIPRAKLKYDFFLITKDTSSVPLPAANDELGFTALYKPFDPANIAANSSFDQKVCIGIDFGTSVTVVSIAYVKAGELQLKTLAIEQTNRDGSKSTSPLVPTVMAVVKLSNGKKQFMLGKHAAEHLPMLKEGENVWAYFKNDLGKLDSIIYDNSILKNNVQLGISNGKEALVAYLGKLREAIQTEVKKIMPKATLCYTWSVPAKYPLIPKNELKACASAAGFPMDEVDLVEEPISALINYVYEQKDADIKQQKILVLDIGAGTVDVSVMDIQTDSDNVNAYLLAVERLDTVGSNQIDALLVDHFRKSPSNLSISPHYCKNLKETICRQINASAATDFALPDKALSTQEKSVPTSGNDISITYAAFNEIMKKYWAKIRPTITGALDKARLDPSQLHKVILSGGGARNPYVQHYCQQYFSSAAIIVSDNIQEQVARGNALQAFAQHNFGKNIINGMLHHDVVLKDSQKVIFAQGTVCPTQDYIIPKGHIPAQIEIIYGKELLTFSIDHTTNDLDKVILQVDADLSITCELVRTNTIDFLTPKITD